MWLSLKVGGSLGDFALCLLLVASLLSDSAMSQDLSLSPIQKCPEPTKNCVLQVRNFNISASLLSDQVLSVLKDMGPESIDMGLVDHHEIKAVFKIWKFRDDFQIAISNSIDQSTLYVKSASREGYFDLGVNKRRINKFFRKLDKSIQAQLDP